MSPSDLGILCSMYGLYVAVIALLLDPSVTRVPSEYTGHFEVVPAFLPSTIYGFLTGEFVLFIAVLRCNALLMVDLLSS